MHHAEGHPYDDQEQPYEQAQGKGIAGLGYPAGTEQQEKCHGKPANQGAYGGDRCTHDVADPVH
jgi:hypothetical protein